MVRGVDDEDDRVRAAVVPFPQRAVPLRARHVPRAERHAPTWKHHTVVVTSLVSVDLLEKRFIQGSTATSLSAAK